MNEKKRAHELVIAQLENRVRTLQIQIYNTKLELCALSCKQSQQKIELAHTYKLLNAIRPKVKK